jgi:predicted ATP-dependent protease
MQVIAKALTGHGPDVHRVERGDELRLRGRGARAGLLAACDGGIVVIDVHDAKAPKVTQALSEAATLGSVLQMTKGKNGDEDASEPVPARVLLVVVGPESALKKWREDHPRVRDWARHRITLNADVPVARDAIRLLAERLRRFASEAGLATPTNGALAALIEEARASTRRGRIVDQLTFAEDVLLEAGAAKALDRRAVEAALDRIAHLGGSREAAHRERITNGRLQLSTRGGLVGVANGLMVYGSGRSAYSIPGRISARVAVGREGVINLERESKYSGRSFDKGVYQLVGYLRSTFAREAPLAVAASLALDQSYGRIDGDSATITEMVAVLSALSGLPCTQSIAITGAMNQCGDLLPVGSLSLKIRGWWTTCRDLGATEGIGVLVPRANLADLHLPVEIQRAIAAGTFRLWAVDTVQQAVEVALGRPAGELRDDRFPDDSVYGLAAATLAGMSTRLYPPRGKGKVAPPEIEVTEATKVAG